jgi:hypothetical protein
VPQTAEERRLVRIAGAYNRKARQFGRRGNVTALDLARVELAQPACHYCAILLEVGQGTFDHIVPLSKGGPNSLTNIVRCCLTCNREKFTKSPGELVIHRDRVVTCARPGCGNQYRPRWAEWQAGRARLCSRRCSALWRHHHGSGT